MGYPKSADLSEYYEFRHNNVIWENDDQGQLCYAKDAQGNEFYPQHHSTRERVFIENKYAKNNQNVELYPTNSNGDQVIIGNRYAKHATGAEFYPTSGNEGEMIIGNRYAKNEIGAEFYPKNNTNDEIFIAGKVFQFQGSE